MVNKVIYSSKIQDYIDEIHRLEAENAKLEEKLRLVDVGRQIAKEAMDENVGLLDEEREGE